MEAPGTKEVASGSRFGEWLIELSQKLLYAANGAAVALDFTVPAMRGGVRYALKFTLASFAHARRILLRRHELGACEV
jgi:hypothetical protein